MLFILHLFHIFTSNVEETHINPPSYDSLFKPPTYEEARQHFKDKLLTEHEVKRLFMIRYMPLCNKSLIAFLQNNFKKAGYNQNFLIPSRNIANDINVIEYLSSVKEPYQRLLRKVSKIEESYTNSLELEIVPSVEDYSIANESKLRNRIEVIRFMKNANLQMLSIIYNTKYKGYKLLKDHQFCFRYYKYSKCIDTLLYDENIIKNLKLETQLIVQKVRELNNKPEKINILHKILFYMVNLID